MQKKLDKEIWRPTVGASQNRQWRFRCRNPNGAWINVLLKHSLKPAKNCDLRSCSRHKKPQMLKGNKRATMPYITKKDSNKALSCDANA